MTTYTPSITARQEIASRVSVATHALRTHLWAKGQQLDEDETSVIDLLTDLRHYCDDRDLNFADLDRVAYQHYSEELVAARAGAK